MRICVDVVRPRLLTDNCDPTSGRFFRRLLMLLLRRLDRVVYRAMRKAVRLERVWFSLNHSVRDTVYRSVRKAVKSDAFASVKTPDTTGDAAGGHWSRTLGASCFLATLCVVPLARTLRYALREPT